MSNPLSIDLAKTVKRLLPGGRAWLVPPGYMRALLAGISVEIGRLAEFLRCVVVESNPGTSTLMQQEWFSQFGMAWTDSGALTTKQRKSLARYVGLGGQDKPYLQNCIDQAGLSSIEIIENAPDDLYFFESTLLNDATIEPHFNYADTAGNGLTITGNEEEGAYYPETLDNDLALSETANTDRYFDSTIDNDLTVVAAPKSGTSVDANYFIPDTLGDNLSITYASGSSPYEQLYFNPATYQFVAGDVGKSVRICGLPTV